MAGPPPPPPGGSLVPPGFVIMWEAELTVLSKLAVPNVVILNAEWTYKLYRAGTTSSTGLDLQTE